MLESMPAEKPLLSMNAPLFHYDDGGEVRRRHDMGVPTTLVNDWGPPEWAPWFDFGPPNTQRPGRTRFVNGNFAFTRGQWNVEVPQDPDHYYWGEELNVTVRSFTWGYDFFLPTEVVVWHMDHRDGPPRRHWENGEEVVRFRRIPNDPCSKLLMVAAFLFPSSSRLDATRDAKRTPTRGRLAISRSRQLAHRSPNQRARLHISVTLPAQGCQSDGIHTRGVST